MIDSCAWGKPRALCICGGGMGRLKSMAGKRLVSLATPRLAPAPTDAKGRFRWRDEHRPSRKWMKTKRWIDLRWSVLVRDSFTCQRCGRAEVDTSQLVADHKIPHHDDEDLFWAEGNLWCLCATCHNGWKQQLERSGGVP